MFLTTENILLIGSVLLFISILAGKTSYKFGVPTMLFFLATGMLAGSEGLGGINFDDPQIAQFIGIVALNFILFSGGLDTSFDTIKSVLWQGLSLSTLGVLITAMSVGFFVYFVADFTIYEGLLLGAIVSSTDASVVFSMLRAKKSALKRKLRPILEFESGSNDPMAYFLVVAFMGLIIYPERNIISVFPLFLKQFLIGGASGILMGMAGKFIINRIKLDFEGLSPVLAIALMFFTFSFTDFTGGNGFLAVYLAGVYLGNQELIHKKSILRAFDGFSWLMEIILFLTLGLLVFPSQILPFLGVGMAISAFLIFVARPLSVMVCLLPFRMQLRERWFISWVGLRGAVPIVFATYPMLAGLEKASMIFNIVFFIALTSIVFQGTTLPMVAKLLHVVLPEKVKKRTDVEKILSDSLKSELEHISIPVGNESAGKMIVDLGLPKTVLIALIKRKGKYITPSGSTVLEHGDLLYVLSENRESIEQVYRCLALGDSRECE